MTRKDSGSSLKVIRQYLRVPRLESIRSRIIMLAVGGALIPAGIALGVAYEQNRRAIQNHLTQDLLSAGNQTAGAMGVWLLERAYDLRVFASSDEVLNNLNRYAVGQGSIPSARLREYLRSLHERFTDFDQIMVLDGHGRLLGDEREADPPGDTPAGLGENTAAARPTRRRSVLGRERQEGEADDRRPRPARRWSFDRIARRGAQPRAGASRARSRTRAIRSAEARIL